MGTTPPQGYRGTPSPRSLNGPSPELHVSYSDGDDLFDHDNAVQDNNSLSYFGGDDGLNLEQIAVLERDEEQMQQNLREVNKKCWQLDRDLEKQEKDMESIMKEQHQLWLDIDKRIAEVTVLKRVGGLIEATEKDHEITLTQEKEEMVESRRLRKDNYLNTLYARRLDIQKQHRRIVQSGIKKKQTNIQKFRDLRRKAQHEIGDKMLRHISRFTQHMVRSHIPLAAKINKPGQHAGRPLAARD